MKKRMLAGAIVAGAIAAMIVVSLAGCGGKTENNETSTSSTTTVENPSEDVIETDDANLEVPVEQDSDKAVTETTESEADNASDLNEQTSETTENEADNVSDLNEQTNETTEDTSAQQSDNATGALTQEQALEAIRKYCIINNPDLEGLKDSEDYTLYWEVTTNEANEIVVLYRAYTGAQTRYYIDPTSGETYVTELVPGIIDEEQRTEESFNVKDYLD